MFEHKGIKIEVTASGEFSALIGKKMEVAASLSLIKKKIDCVTSFEEFDALAHSRWDDAAYLPVRIIGIEKARGKKSVYNAGEWFASNGKKFRSVIKDTPEARSAMQNLYELSALNKAERKKMDNRHSDAYGKAQALLPTALTVE